MTKIADCIEHGVLCTGWVRLERLPHTRKLARRSIRSDKKFHGMVHAHIFNYPTYLGGMVLGLNGRQLLNKGGKP